MSEEVSNNFNNNGNYSVCLLDISARVFAPKSSFIRFAFFFGSTTPFATATLLIDDDGDDDDDSEDIGTASRCENGVSDD